jgi:hypothetical protein
LQRLALPSTSFDVGGQRSRHSQIDASRSAFTREGRNALDDCRQSPIDFWQIFGKMGFDDNSPYEGKVRIAAYLLMI